MRFKTNVAFDLIYEEEENAPIGPEDYYMLSLNHVSNSVKVSKSVCEKHLCFPQYSWTFFKPRERNCDLNFKGGQAKYLTFYFNEEWLRKNLMHNQLFIQGGLDRFIQSPDKYLMWPLSGTEPVINNFELYDQIMNIGGDLQQTDLLSMKYHTLSLIFDFFRFCKEERVIDTHLAIEYEDKFTISKVENYLRNHLLEKFPGIPHLAREFNISETKLKTEFKQLFGKPVYQYFQEKQMLAAKEILTENQLLIKEISYRLGYENTSKFSAAFKKHHGYLPSALPYQQQ
ncbi:AraC family transcriptional regulator [Chitinophaga sp. sic0106]|uniref:helix-turn-helix domain-containing protein n=1 Tax=Chitinophaga sp. sic0106 TaxID=2854785 RepID=UPI001C47E453|nr:AraC family transcriptional regulator [Chitinophaga sp. sic0106]MBV7529897.1 AraC family transcriptional regulator [Chitinophaga sp. sic0106]